MGQWWFENSFYRIYISQNGVHVSSCDIMLIDKLVIPGKILFYGIHVYSTHVYACANVHCAQSLNCAQRIRNSVEETM